MGQFYGYAALQASKFPADPVTSSLSGLANLSDRSFTISLTEAFAFQNAVPFSVKLSWSGGGADKEFTWATSNNALAISFNVRADF